MSPVSSVLAAPSVPSVSSVSSASPVLPMPLAPSVSPASQAFSLLAIVSYPCRSDKECGALTALSVVFCNAHFVVIAQADLDI